MRLSKPILLSLAALLLALASGCGAAPQSSGSSRGHATNAQAKHFDTLSVPANAPAHSVRVPILTYHRVHRYETEATKSVPDLTVEPEVFAEQLAALGRGGFHTISQRQLFHALYRHGTLPSRPILISVDDGYVDDVSVILPLLKRAHMVATFYVITRRFHESGFLSAAQVRQLELAGMEIGAHTRLHVALTGLDSARLASEVAGSQEDLTRVLGHPVYWFAYPFGVFDVPALNAVRQAGFLLAVTTHSGRLESSRAPLTMPRLHVGRTMTPSSLLAQLGPAVSTPG